MQKILKKMQLIFTVATIGIVLLLCWQCLDIYLDGNQPENMNAGVYLTPVYSVEKVGERLAMVSPLLIVYAVIAVAAVIAQICWGKPARLTGKVHTCSPRSSTGKMLGIRRLVVLFLGVLFIVLGAMNGGARDVLIKAINICTECIGLG